jgi:cytochrome c556
MARKQKSKRGSGSKDDRTDWSRYNKFKEENEKLRKEVSKLRKMLQEVLVDRLEKKQARVERDEPAMEPCCERCGNTDIKKITIPRPDGKFEIITCKSCKFRSDLKRMK